jgi:hypothetical protein
MQIVKIFAALLVAACAAQTFATQAKAGEATRPALSHHLDAQGCRSARTYQYRYRERVYRPSPFSHPRHRIRYRKPNPND